MQTYEESKISFVRSIFRENRRILFLMLSFLLAASFQPQIKIETSPFLSVYFAGRAGSPKLPASVSAAGTAVSSAGEGLMRAALVDARAVSCSTAEEFGAICAEMPESLGVPAKAYADALKQLSPGDIKKFGELDSSKLTAAARQTEEEFRKNAGLLSNAGKSLGFKQTDSKVRIIFVPSAPAPHAVTYRSFNGPVSVVAVDSFSGSQLTESVLHESLHALDIQNQNEESVIVQLKKSLQGHDVKGSSEAIHAVIFATAEFWIKKSNPNHKAYGDSGAYNRMSPGGRGVLSTWKDCLSGKIERKQALKMITDSVPTLVIDRK